MSKIKQKDYVKYRDCVFIYLFWRNRLVIHHLVFTTELIQGLNTYILKCVMVAPFQKLKVIWDISLSVSKLFSFSLKAKLCQLKLQNSSPNDLLCLSPVYSLTSYSTLEKPWNLIFCLLKCFILVYSPI